MSPLILTQPSINSLGLHPKGEYSQSPDNLMPLMFSRRALVIWLKNQRVGNPPGTCGIQFATCQALTAIGKLPPPEGKD
jgi:hypothetical protein